MPYYLTHDYMLKILHILRLPIYYDRELIIIKILEIERGEESFSVKFLKMVRDTRNFIESKKNVSTDYDPNSKYPWRNEWYQPPHLQK